MIETLIGRYELLEPLGSGGQGATYIARDLERAEQVVVKELRLDRIVHWKAAELFEREGRTLQGLDHPAIPAYVDAFEITSDEGSPTRYFLVQAWVEGENFEQLLANSLHFDEAQGRAFLLEMLEILAYLHAQEPSVI